jgi:hypothetical protein
MSGVNRQLFLYCLDTYTFFKFKGTPSFKVEKKWFQHEKATQISFVESMYCIMQIPFSGVLINGLIYTGNSYIPLLSALLSAAQNLHCLL